MANVKPIFRGLSKWVLALLAPLVFAMWATDWVTMQGEWTIYTAGCSGEWKGNECTGSRLAGPRYRFRALRARGEVLFWTVGTPEPSGRLTPCKVENRRTWTCSPGPDAHRAITLELSKGTPMPNAQSSLRPKIIPKLSWYYLRFTRGRAS